MDLLRGKHTPQTEFGSSLEGERSGSMRLSSFYRGG